MKIEEDIFSFPEEHNNKKTDYSGNDTYGVRLIKYLIKNSKLSEFLTDNGFHGIWNSEKGVSEYSYVYLTFNLTINGHKSRIPYQTIFRCRTFIPPEYWFYKVTETIPETINYSPKYIEFDDDFYNKATVGHEKLKKYLENHSQKETATLLNISVEEIKNLLRKRKRPNGKIGYHSLPQEKAINDLKPIVKPIEWFIFPEEME